MCDFLFRSIAQRVTYRERDYSDRRRRDRPVIKSYLDQHSQRWRH